ncbi:MAG: permease [Firmicutes bacterium]|nr:permease [Bacillota bacterium]MCL5039534.1 permease [Bacillota bacterium]
MLQSLADLATYRWLHLTPGTRPGEAVNFFLYDITKVFLLLATVIYVVTLLRTFFPVERTRRLLSGKRELWGNMAAALLGIVTPFCSCSAVPMFIGFIESGIPLGVTFSFLISSPMVNEVALVLLLGLFGWSIAGMYILSGVIIAVLAGYVIGKLHLEKEVEEYVYNLKVRAGIVPEYSWADRHAYAWSYVKDILRRVWPYVTAGIGLGAFIHGYAPAEFLAGYAGRGNFLAVPLAVAIGVPLYSNAAGIIPVVSVLLEKGVSLGTALAFMMAVTALSLPEMIILRKVLKPRLIMLFIGILTVSIITVGYLFNLLVA